jgi:hypothetical protein
MRSRRRERLCRVVVSRRPPAVGPLSDPPDKMWPMSDQPHPTRDDVRSTAPEHGRREVRLPPECGDLVVRIKTEVRAARVRAARAVNVESIDL